MLQAVCLFSTEGDFSAQFRRLQNHGRDFTRQRIWRVKMGRTVAVFDDGRRNQHPLWRSDVATGSLRRLWSALLTIHRAKDNPDADLRMPPLGSLYSALCRHAKGKAKIDLGLSGSDDYARYRRFVLYEGTTDSARALDLYASCGLQLLEDKQPKAKTLKDAVGLFDLLPSFRRLFERQTEDADHRPLPQLQHAITQRRQ